MRVLTTPYKNKQAHNNSKKEKPLKPHPSSFMALSLYSIYSTRQTSKYNSLNKLYHFCLISYWPFNQFSFQIVFLRNKILMTKLKAMCILFPFSFFPTLLRDIHYPNIFGYHFLSICFLFALHTATHSYTHKHMVFYMPWDFSSIVYYYTYSVKID